MTVRVNAGVNVGIHAPATSFALTEPTGTQRRQLAIVRERAPAIQAALQAFVTTELKALEAKADAAGVPYTPGRTPR